MELKLALIGFGNVGQGLAQILRDRGALIEEECGVRMKIVAVSDVRLGSVHDPRGLDPAALLESAAGGNLGTLGAPHRGWNAIRTITESDADVVAELSYTDLKTAEPAQTHVRVAFEMGRHVVTTNKGPVALHYRQLEALARSKGVDLGIEGTVMSGSPVLHMGRELLAAAGIERIQGILNGTTNFILTEMEGGATYADALAKAQHLGYAEADPRGDVEGHDAAAKVVILANLLMGASLTLADVDRTGIVALTPDDVASARANGERWKLLGKVAREGGEVRASVKPTRLPLTHPLASVSGATNAITFTTELLGDVTVAGPGAGRLETGYALIQDILAIARRQARG